MLTATDLFCGAGGSSLGAELSGKIELKLGLNHWQRAIETHSANFQNADHDCADVSALTTAQIRRYPPTDILMASPECTNHSIAKGGRRKPTVSGSLWDDGPAGTDEQDRSRATMWDVPRFAEQKILQGHPYKAIIVENVTDAFKWGYNDNGGLFQAWLQAMEALGYQHELVFLNSMFVPPTPQSRDRMYVVFWHQGVRRPNLKVEPLSWCPTCEKLVYGRQAWKKMPRCGKYGQQYLYSCPDCFKTVIPGAFPAASAIDWTDLGERIGSRKKDLAEATRARIKRGLERLSGEPFAVKLLHGVNPRPLTLPIVTLSQRHDLAMVLPIAGNTFERTPGNRARNADRQPMDTLHKTLDRAIVGVVELQRNGDTRSAHERASHTIRAAGRHHGVVVAHYKPGWTRDADEHPVGPITTRDSHSLVLPYYRTGVALEAEREPNPTVSTRDRLALVVPEKDAPAPTPREWSDKDIDDCRFRMFQLHEIAETMQMHEHTTGDEYVVTGNKRERMAQYGNAVTPPVMRLLTERVAEALAA